MSLSQTASSPQLTTAERCVLAECCGKFQKLLQRAVAERRRALTQRLRMHDGRRLDGGRGGEGAPEDLGEAAEGRAVISEAWARHKACVQAPIQNRRPARGIQNLIWALWFFEYGLKLPATLGTRLLRGRLLAMGLMFDMRVQATPP